MEALGQRRSALLVHQQTLVEIAAKLFMGAENPVAEQLAAADVFAQKAYVTLAVVGAEGAGKSSLVDAILDEDVVPRESQMPGTVAPVEVFWSPEKTASYAVKFEGNDVRMVCDDAAEFRKFLLQRYNPDNRAGVEYGVVTYRHPVLEHGLVLVDMPGLEGASAAIRREAQEALAAVDRAVLVVRDRQYGAATRLLEEQGKTIRIEAVVSNWSADGWAGSEDEQREFVESQKRILTEELGWNLAIDTSRVFVLHVPSVDDCQIRTGALVDSAVHRAEVARFGEWITEYMGQEAAARLLDYWEDALRAPAQALAEWLSGHVGHLDRVASKEQPFQGELLAYLDRLEGEMLADWAKLGRDADVTRAVDRHWNELIPAIRQARDAFAAAARAGRSATPPGGGRWTQAAVTPLAADLAAWVAPTREHLEQEHEEALLGVMTVLREKANRLVVDLNRAGLFAVGPLPPVRVEVGLLLDFTPPGGTLTTFADKAFTKQFVSRMVADYEEIQAALSGNGLADLYRRFEADTDVLRRGFEAAIGERIEVARAAIRAPDNPSFVEFRESVSRLNDQAAKIADALK